MIVELEQSFNDLFTEGCSKLTFEFELSKLLATLGPWAKALKCLESAHVTADTVYFYWLAIMAQLEEDLKKNRFKMPMSTIEDIRAIANRRFNEMVEDNPNDTYLLAFFLNPSTSPSHRWNVLFLTCDGPVYRTAPIYKNRNALATSSVIINRKPGETPTATVKPPAELLDHV